MSLARLMRQPLTVRANVAGPPDDYGNTTSTWTTSSVLGYLEWAGSDEALVDRDTVKTQWIAYLFADVAVSALDQVANGTATYEVMGQPERVWNPRVGAVSHVVVRLSEMAG